MKSKWLTWPIAALALSAGVWAQEEPVRASDGKSSVVSEDGFKETAPPEIGLQPGAIPSAKEEEAGPQDIPPPGAPPMPEWWDAAKTELDKEIDKRQGGGEAATPAGEGSQTGNAGSVRKGSGWSPWKSLAQVVAAFAVVLAMMILLNYLLGRFGKKVPILAGANLGAVIGRLYLSPKACLYFVRVKGKVLIVGVTPTSVSAVAELEASEFETAPVSAALEAKGTPKAGPSSPAADKFLAQLKTFMGTNPQKSGSREDDEIATLRGDIARLRRELKEGTQEPGD